MSSNRPKKLKRSRPPRGDADTQAVLLLVPHLQRVRRLPLSPELSGIVEQFLTDAATHLNPSFNGEA
ncbi:hypothetical protein SK069_09710 [Patulibacter brassicae]|uniref:Uncharacterized protein n=1 Tax=Patulibacter brassicae TaxID=1705717 RepID=A0ABU4VJ95_9ACTN|nr:hypothetical protein [Patulibacter brassicae]MDX8151868.1 hypothetical protein [Patulibacter brassicae]